MERDILKIDENLCTGCGLCVPDCHEGALQVIDGKVRLISEIMCDGLGACIGNCPEGAITIEKREAEPYNETRVMEQIITKGKNTVIAHLKHLKDHSETGFLKEGVIYLKEYSNDLNFNLEEVLSEIHNHGKTVAVTAGLNTQVQTHNHQGGGCPGSGARVIEKPGQSGNQTTAADQLSELRQWPVQMHLINPDASYFHGADLLLAADCVAFSMGAFHNKYLKGKSLVIACPKLDHSTELYVQKLIALIDNAKVNTITVMMMEVPCCGGLLQMVRIALSQASAKVPVRMIIAGIAGDVLKDEWI